MIRTFRSTILAAVVATSLWTLAPARGDWIETFTGGYDQTWDFFDSNGSRPPSDTMLSTMDDQLQITGMLTGNWDEFVVGLVPESFTDVRVQARVSPSLGLTFTGALASTNNNVFILTRSNGLEGYLLSLDYHYGTVDLVRIGDMGQQISLAQVETPAGFDPAESYDLELVALGTELLGRVYHTNGSLLAEVQASDATLLGGQSGLGTAINGNDDIPLANLTLLAAVFDNVSSQAIPEPASLLFAAVGLVTLIVLRHRRSLAD